MFSPYFRQHHVVKVTPSISSQMLQTKICRFIQQVDFNPSLMVTCFTNGLVDTSFIDGTRAPKVLDPAFNDEFGRVSRRDLHCSDDGTGVSSAPDFTPCESSSRFFIHFSRRVSSQSTQSHHRKADTVVCRNEVSHLAISPAISSIVLRRPR